MFFVLFEWYSFDITSVRNGHNHRVGQAFTQLQNSATALVGEIDRVSGSGATLAGVAQAASESLDNIARAFRDTQSAQGSR